MIRLDMEQGSPEWIEARLGIPTASQFHRIVTPAKCELSKAADGYMHELLAERLIGDSLDPDVTQLMERGGKVEPQAIRYYEMQRDVDVEKVGFCLTDDRKAGASPDGLIEPDGGLEVKAPGAAVHVAYMLNVTTATKYKCQIQGALWVTGRDWWDWVSFNPELPTVLCRFERDEEFITKLAAAVGVFCERLDEAERRLRDA